MPNAPAPGPEPSAAALVERLQRVLADTARSDSAPATWAAVEEMLASLEAATPGAPWVHSRIDTVRRWIAILRAGGDLTRFGGGTHVRDHVDRELRGLAAAIREAQRTS